MKKRSFSAPLCVFTAAALLAFHGGCVAEPAQGAAEDRAAEAPAAAEGDSIDAFVDSTGALHFPTAQAFFDALDVLSEWTEAERVDWEKSLGFRSFQTAYTELLDAAAEMEDEQAAALLSAHPELVILDGGEPRPVIPAAGYAALAGPDGVFYAEGTIHKVLSEVVVSVEDGDVGAVEVAAQELSGSGVIVGPEVLSLPSGARVARYVAAYEGGFAPPGGEVVSGDAPAPPPPPGCTWSRNAFYLTSDRKVEFTLSTFRYICFGCCNNYFQSVLVELKLHGQKTNWRGRWEDYTTSYNEQNTGMELVAPHVTGYNGVSSIFNDQSYAVSFPSAGSSPTRPQWLLFARVGDQVQNASISLPYFDKVKGQGKSIGTGVNGWANICCGYAGGCGF